MMRSLPSRSARWLLVLAAVFLLLGCGGADRPAASPQYESSPGAPPVAGSGGSAHRDREVVAADVAFKKSPTSDEPAPAPAGYPGAPPPPPPPPKAEPADGSASTTPSQPAGSSGAPKADVTKDAIANRDLVIYTAHYTMAVYQVEQGLLAVEKIARDHGGYLGVKKDREITVRVPRGRFESALGAVDRIGDVLHRDISAEDVTDEHVDLEIRIKNARAMQRRLSDLLQKANVKEALEIEKELHRVTEELERLEGRMKVLRDKIAFSTITVSFEARGSTIQTQRVRLPFPWLSALNLPTLLQLSEEK